MNDDDLLADRFEQHRGQLRAVAYRMLGSVPEAEDAVQETWLRLSRTGADEIRNLGGWLTTVVGRVCLDLLRVRAARREDPIDETFVPDPLIAPLTHLDPEEELLKADSVGLALLVVLETLEPAERLAFVLHDLFAVPFDDIAPIVERTSATTRQLASRARRRVQAASPSTDPDLARQREIVEAFLAAAREGDFDALVALLHPDVALRADSGALVRGAAASRHCAARTPSPNRPCSSRRSPTTPDSPWSTARWASSTHPTARWSRSWASPSPTAGSPRCTSCPTRNDWPAST